MDAEAAMSAAITQATDEGMTESEIIYMVKLLAAAETARRRDEAARKLYGAKS